jgi:hypothetical protein
VLMTGWSIELATGHVWPHQQGRLSNKVGRDRSGSTTNNPSEIETLISHWTNSHQAPAAVKVPGGFDSRGPVHVNGEPASMVQGRFRLRFMRSDGGATQSRGICRAGALPWRTWSTCRFLSGGGRWGAMIQ